MEEFFRQSAINADIRRGVYKPPTNCPSQQSFVAEPSTATALPATALQPIAPQETKAPSKKKKQIDVDDYDPDEIIDVIIAEKPSVNDTRKLLQKFVNRFDNDN